MSQDALVLLSGGIDSAACAGFLRDQGYRIRCLFVDYGQKAVPFEKRAAEALSQFLVTPLDFISLASGSRFGSGEIPGRNAFLLLVALLTCRLNTGVIAIGIHSGTTYYDCSTAFAESMDRLLAEHTDGRIRLSAPFISWDKRNIFEYCQASGLPIELTYSCENGGMPTCGTCLSCLDRRMLGC